MDKTLKEKLEILPIKNIQHPVGDTKYYAAIHVKTLIAQADEEIANLKSQLQQQALPVVPEFVGLGISEDIQLNTVVADVLTTVITSDDKDLKEYGLWIKENLVTYVIARTLGYQVEKPQLFFLKNTLTHEYLYRKYKTSLGEQSYCKGTDGKPLDYCLFTLDEIESMNTGSYEQIEVAE
ncbi:DUF1642 domain-containing protein [Lactococcus lactis]|uniref:DUF1642 domain-containing protein n=1 Tax=Lactococcus lactis TaxID=1358 RepID=UPI00398F7E1B